MKSDAHRAEMVERAERRAARRDRSLQSAANRIALRELRNRIDHKP